MKIDTKPLNIGKETIEVDGTWSQQDKADELMIASLETQTNKGMIEALKANRKFRQKAMEFFKDILKLTDKEVAKIYENISSSVLNLYVSYACGIVEGAQNGSFAEFEKAVKEEAAPKEQSEKSKKQ